MGCCLPALGDAVVEKKEEEDEEEYAPEPAWAVRKERAIRGAGGRGAVRAVRRKPVRKHWWDMEKVVLREAMAMRCQMLDEADCPVQIVGALC